MELGNPGNITVDEFMGLLTLEWSMRNSNKALDAQIVRLLLTCCAGFRQFGDDFDKRTMAEIIARTEHVDKVMQAKAAQLDLQRVQDQVRADVAAIVKTASGE